jgi:hypothetical protein
MIERNTEHDTLGLGHWSEPADWCKVPFSHTVTVANDAWGYMGGWHIYNSGVVVALDVQSLDGPFDRGAPYVWCKQFRNHNGTMNDRPTAPLFGRFIEHTSRGPKVLSGRGQSAVIGSEYAYCFRAVGVVHSGCEFFAHSEIPAPIPSVAVRIEQPEQFDMLEHQTKQLDHLLSVMSDVVDMTDALADAEKATDANDAAVAKAWRQSRSYAVLETLVAAALHKSGHVSEGMAEYLKASPELAHYLGRWRSDNRA